MASFPSRRSFVTGGLAALGAAAAGKLAGQDVGSMTAMRTAAAHASITPQPLRGGVSMLRGPFGNIAVLVRPEGAIVVDSGLSDARPQIQAALAALSPRFPATLINTHWHVDHTDGNEWMHAQGATITAHRNTLKRLSSPQVTAVLQQTTPAAPPAARPTEVFETETRKRLGDVSLALRYYQPAHTDSDICIHFEEPDVLHVGDIWYNGFYPLIDYSSGGSIGGVIAAVELTLKRVSTATIIVPGHGPVGDHVQLGEWHEMLCGVRDRVTAAKQAGKTLAEVLAGKPTATYDGRFVARAIPVDVFVACVYATV